MDFSFGPLCLDLDGSHCLRTYAIDSYFSRVINSAVLTGAPSSEDQVFWTQAARIDTSYLSSMSAFESKIKANNDSGIPPVPFSLNLDN